MQRTMESCPRGWLFFFVCGRLIFGCGATFFAQGGDYSDNYRYLCMQLENESFVILIGGCCNDSYNAG